MGLESLAEQGAVCVSPVVPKQDVQGGQCAKLQRSLVLAQEGGQDGDGVREHWPQVDLERRAGDQRQSCGQTHTRQNTAKHRPRLTAKQHLLIFKHKLSYLNLKKNKEAN